MIYTFRSYQLNTETYELHCNGELCRIEIRALMVLTYLIENRDHIVSRDELVDNVWATHFLSEGIINNCLTAARKAIKDIRGEQEMIRTIYGVGYRFVAEVEEINLGVTLNGGNSVAPPPLFLEPESDINRVGTTTVSSSTTFTRGPQNVLEGDYYFVTVACGGLVQINMQGEDMGGEAKRRLRRSFFARAQELVKESDGGFRLFGLDGFLAIFGWPILHEDHAQRAVRAGLRLQEEISAEAPIETSVCIGLHTGPIELRHRRDSLATVPLTASETTALAIRLQHLAKPGLLLTSSATLPLLQNSMECVKHDSVYLPRLSGSILAYRIVRPTV